MLELRLVEAGYANALAELMSTTFKQAYRGVHSDSNLQAYCDYHFAPDVALSLLRAETVRCTVALRDGEPAGFSLLKHHACPIPLAGRSTELKQVYVLQQEYGTGLGKLLLDDALTKTRHYGSQWLWLIVAHTNQRAQSFYTKSNFVRHGAGPVLRVGTDELASTIMACSVLPIQQEP